MKEAVLITDVVNELSVERKILKKYKLILSEPGKLNKKDILLKENILLTTKKEIFLFAILYGL